MQQNLFPNNKHEIYQNYLHELNGIKFTIREIDVISCIICNRGNKKIASLLDISNRTVDSHVYNIISKINKNSREDIIDFVETSSKIVLVKQYYLCLRIEAAFNRKLSYIAKVINRQVITYIISDTNLLASHEINSIITQKLQQLQKDLKLANVDLQLQVSRPVHFYILKPNNEHTIDQEIGVLVDAVVSHPISPKMEYIDFTANQNYFVATFNLLQKIINKPELDNIKEEFQKEYDAIINNIENVTEQLQQNHNNDNTQKKQYTIIASIFNNKSAKIITTILISCLIISIIFIFKAYNTNTPQVTNITTQNLNQIIKELISAGFTASNITTEQITKNHDLIKKVENLIKESKHSHYFNSIVISSNEISSYLYIIHSIASYYLFHEELQKANELLEYGKNIIEQYINSRNKHKLDFSKFQSSELYQELAIIKDFPQIYTQIIYMLGRANMLLGNINKALYCFQIAKDLGDKLKLFEGYLSLRSGIGIIQGNKAIQEIQSSNYKAIEIKLKELVELYKLLKNDDKPYIINYQSSDIEHKTIIPNQDLFSQLVCTRRILYYLVFLLEITDNTTQEKCLQEIFDQLIGSNNHKGLLELVNNVSNKESAKTYNIIGNLLLKLYDNNIKFDLLQKAITEKMKLNESDELDLIKQIFDIAKDKSRSMESNKASSYDGLAQVYVRKLKQTNSQIVKKELIDKIASLKEKRDEINKALNLNLQINPFNLKE